MSAELAGRYTPEELTLYCHLAIAIFRSIAALPPMRAGDAMSAIFTGWTSPTGARRPRRSYGTRFYFRFLSRLSSVTSVPVRGSTR